MKLHRSILSVLLICAILAFPMNAYAADSGYTVDIPGASARSYDSSFTLDFSASSGWTLNFDNNAFAVWNHRFVTVDYDSCAPSNSSAKVKVVLYIDDNEDGTYEIYDPNGGYTYQLTAGDYIKIKLPYVNTVMKYRLLIVNQTSSVTSGTFTVTTSRN